MLDIEKTKHAREYMLSLANGIDPISGAELPDDTCLNNVRLARCFFYVAEVLDDAIQNGGRRREAKPKQDDFIVSEELISRIAVTPVTQIAEFAKRVSEAANDLGMRNIPYTAFTNWLVECGMLREYTVNDKKRKAVNQSSATVGIISEDRTNAMGMEYTAIIYTDAAQQFLLDNLPQIAEHWKQSKSS
jgi:hypothetical protein